MKRTRTVGNRALTGCRRVCSRRLVTMESSLSLTAPRPSSPYRDLTSFIGLQRPSVPNTLGKPNKRAEMHAHNQVESATGGPWAATSPQIQRSVSSWGRWRLITVQSPLTPEPCAARDGVSAWRIVTWWILTRAPVRVQGVVPYDSYIHGPQDTTVAQ